MEKNRQGTTKKSKGLTPREKLLVFVLAIVAISFLYLYFFLLPTMDRIDELEIERDALQTEYNLQLDLIARIDEFSSDIESLESGLEEFYVQYFPTTNQEHFIKILEENLIADNDLEVPALTFNEAQEMNFLDSDEESLIELLNSRVFLPYFGSYEGVIELVSRLENFGQVIRINNLSITQDQDADEYFGNISIDFFSIPQDFDYPWNGELPDYTMAPVYDRSLFYFSAEDLPPDENDIDEEDEEDNGENDNGNDTEVDDDPEDDDEAADDDEDTDPGDYITYLVQPGDTLNQISNDFYGTTAYVPEIMRLNNITDPRRLLWGTTIRLPRP